MELKLDAKSGTEVQAAYICSCGCKPRVTYARDADNRKHVCCCGAQLVVGREAVDGLDLMENSRPQIEKFDAPWGEVIEAAWLVGSGMHEGGHGPEGHRHGDHSHSH